MQGHEGKALYLPSQNDYGHQNLQVNNLLLYALTYNVTWTFHHVVLLDHQKNYNLDTACG